MSSREKIEGIFPNNMMCEMAGIPYNENIESRKINMFLDLYKLLGGNGKEMIAYYYSHPNETITSIVERYNIEFSRIYSIKNLVFKRLRYYAILLTMTGNERLEKILSMSIKDVYGCNAGGLRDITVEEYLTPPVVFPSLTVCYILNGKLRLAGITRDLEGNILPLFVGSVREYPYLTNLLLDLSNRLLCCESNYKNYVYYFKGRLGVENVLRAIINQLYDIQLSGNTLFSQRALDIVRYRYIYKLPLRDTGEIIGTNKERVRQIERKLIQTICLKLDKKAVLHEILEYTERGELIPLRDRSLIPFVDLRSINACISTTMISAIIVNLLDHCSIKSVLLRSNSYIKYLLKSDVLISQLYSALEKSGYCCFFSGEPFKIDDLCPIQGSFIKIVNSNGGF